MTKCSNCDRSFKQINKHKCKSIPAPTPIQLQEAKAVLVKCGETYINPKDVSSIKKVKMGLFVVRMVSEPNPVYPIWLREAEVGNLIQFFKIVGDL